MKQALPRISSQLSPLLWLFLALALLSPGGAGAAAEGARSIQSLKEWQFSEDKARLAPLNASKLPVPPAGGDWKPVRLPHVFRQSGLPDESAGWYRLNLHPEAAERGESFYLVLEGAASVKDVFVNGQHAGQHRGAYSRAAFDLTPKLKFGQDNTLDVRVSNRPEEAQNCFSRSTLYYINGGMFRPAWLVKAGAVHFYPDMGSTGLYLTPKNITAAAADLEFRAVIKNTLAKPAQVQLRYTLQGPNGEKMGEFLKQQTIGAGQLATIATVGKVPHPQLWDLGKPNLYTVSAEVVVDGKVTDQLEDHTGFRTISWKENRFYLNGREVQFRGVNKHSQNEVAWNAVGDGETRWEWQMMADMGANAVRLAHYPHRSLEYDIADEKGMAVWAENGYAGEAWKGVGNEEKTVTADGERLTREMVRQNWNHPSIFFWSAGNETIVDVVSHYAQTIHGEKDPNRLVTYAANGKHPQNCDFVANNTYDGWYSGHFSQFADLPRNALVSETGCGDWITHHVPYGKIQWSVDKFEPEEYAGIFTEYRLQTICRNDAANRPMFFWWNFREFYNLKFKQNRNTKGLLTLAGAPKDLYYLFQAFFNPAKPVLHLCGRDFFLRSFAPDNGIKVYSNAKAVELVLNGVSHGKQLNGAYRLPDSEIKKKNGPINPVPGIAVNNVFFWKAPLQPGKNLVEVRDDRGGKENLVIYQKSADGGCPSDPDALVVDLQSSNRANPAVFIDRPIQAQGAVYTEVDGSSDNTFDQLPEEIQGASWIATGRMSNPKLQTNLSFQVNPNSKGTTVSVIFSTGLYPVVTLKKVDPAIQSAAEGMRKALGDSGFKPVNTEAVWRDHDLNRANAEIWSRSFQAGEKVEIPGRALDYVVLLGGKS